METLGDICRNDSERKIHMGKRSVKENKSIYQLAREEMDWTRAEAAEAIGCISESRLEKLESGKTAVYPEDVLAMAKTYKKPSLCNLYCSQECAIGQEYVPEVQVKELPTVTLEILATLNKLEEEKDRLIEITVDGEISEDELADFRAIQNQLDKLALSIDSLKAWVDNTIASGKIDKSLL